MAIWNLLCAMYTTILFRDHHQVVAIDTGMLVMTLPVWSLSLPDDSCMASAIISWTCSTHDCVSCGEEDRVLLLSVRCNTCNVGAHQYHCSPLNQRAVSSSYKTISLKTERGVRHCKHLPSHNMCSKEYTAAVKEFYQTRCI